MSRHLSPVPAACVVFIALGVGLAVPAAGADATLAPAPPAAAPGPPPTPAAPTPVVWPVARAAVVDGDGDPDAVSPRIRGIALSLGVRTDLVRSAGFDPFSERDGLPQLSLAARYLLAPAASIGFALGVSWDHGSSTAIARAASTSLETNRLSLTFEGRLPVSRHLTALVRVAPGWLWRSTALDDGGLPNAPYTTTSIGRAHQLTSTVSGDASVGLEYLLGRLRTATGQPGLGFSLLADGGYSYSPSRDVVLSSSGSMDPSSARTDEPIRLGKLAVGGAFFRFAAALSL